MNIIYRLLCNLAESAADVTGYHLQKILVLRAKALDKLDKGWSIENFTEMEEARELAKDKDHFFEETLILLEEMKYILKNHPEEGYFYLTYERLKQLAFIYDLPKDEFNDLFCRSYLNTKYKKIISQTYECLPRFYVEFDKLADFMNAHLYPDLSVLCGKVKLKLNDLCENIEFEDIMETMFFMANCYGRIRDINNAMKYYTISIELAKSRKDDQYYYIACIRKLSVCLVSNQIDGTNDLDAETNTVFNEILSLCDRYETSLYELPKLLIDKENNSNNNRKDFRLARLEECEPMLNVNLALARGDIMTAQKYIDKLKVSESKAYGSNPDFSNAQRIIEMYHMAFDSIDRREYAVETFEDETQIEDEGEPFMISFPDEVLLCDRFDTLLRYIRNEISCKHFNQARAFATQAFEIATSVFSTYHQAMALHCLAQCYEQASDIEEALKYYNLAYSLLDEADKDCTNADLSPYLQYTVLFEIGDLQIKSDAATAATTFKAALDKEIPELPFQNLIEMGLAKSLFALGKFEEAEDHLLSIITRTLLEAQRRVRLIEGDHRELYCERFRELVSDVMRYVRDESKSELKIQVYNALLFVKGIRLLSEISIKRSVAYAGVTTKEQYKELMRLNKQRNKYGTLTEDSSEEYMRTFVIEHKLMTECETALKEIYKESIIDYEKVRQSMSGDTVIIDFIDYETDTDRQYCAWVYRKEDESPILVKVCTEKEIQKLLISMADVDGDYHASELYNRLLPYGNEMAKLIWSPLFHMLNDSDQIVVIPSGSLHHIAIGSLPTESNVFGIIEDCYKSFSTYSHVRYFTNADETIDGDISLFGGLDYGGDHNANASSPYRGYISINKGEKSSELREWEPLPNSSYEIRCLSFMWNVADDNIYTDLRGTVDNFLSLSLKNPEVLHIATHGFCEYSKSASNLPALSGAYRPMDLTGLILSNGNKGWMGISNNKHEGIVTATDIASMDLSQTSMAILSACYSGDGEVKSDGVYGLQRALKKAGVKSLVLSLWNEADEAGSQFMIEFYTRLRKGLPRKHAFKEAKREIRKRYPHPVYWAGMIMID